MELKDKKSLLKEANYQNIIRQRKEYAGRDCFTVVVDNEVIPIGYQYENKNCLDFLRNEIQSNPNGFVARGHFQNLVAAYSYLLDCCDDEPELKDFLSDYYDGVEMEDYGK